MEPCSRYIWSWHWYCLFHIPSRIFPFLLMLSWFLALYHFQLEFLPYCTWDFNTNSLVGYDDEGDTSHIPQGVKCDTGCPSATRATRIALTTRGIWLTHCQRSSYLTSLFGFYNLCRENFFQTVVFGKQCDMGQNCAIWTIFHIALQNSAIWLIFHTHSYSTLTHIPRSAPHIFWHSIFPESNSVELASLFYLANLLTTRKS